MVGAIAAEAFDRLRRQRLDVWVCLVGHVWRVIEDDAEVAAIPRADSEVAPGRVEGKRDQRIPRPEIRHPTTPLIANEGLVDGEWVPIADEAEPSRPASSCAGMHAIELPQRGRQFAGRRRPVHCLRLRDWWAQVGQDLRTSLRQFGLDRAPV
jgi:hypothetical protein